MRRQHQSARYANNSQKTLPFQKWICSSHRIRGLSKFQRTVSADAGTAMGGRMCVGRSVFAVRLRTPSPTNPCRWRSGASPTTGLCLCFDLGISPAVEIAQFMPTCMGRGHRSVWSPQANCASQTEYRAERAMADRMSDSAPNIYVNSNEGTMGTNSCSKLDSPSLGISGSGPPSLRTAC